MRYCELSNAIDVAKNGEEYVFYAQRVERGYCPVDGGRVYFGGHVFRGGKSLHCLIVEVPTLYSSIHSRSHHFVWYYVKKGDYVR